MPLNDPCPVCGKRHRKLPHECIAKVANLHVVVCDDRFKSQGGHSKQCLISAMREWLNTSYLLEQLTPGAG